MIIPTIHSTNNPITNKVILSPWDRIYSIYHAAISHLADFFNDWNLNGVTVILGTLLLEPHHVLKAVFHYFKGIKNEFHPYGLNSHSITLEQAKKNPILLIHGAFHNQSGWMELAKKIQDSNLGPVYTVNLPSGWIGDKDFQILKMKTEEIQSHYQRHGIQVKKIDVVAHSRGGRVAERVVEQVIGSVTTSFSNDFKKTFPIGKIIKLGSILYPLQIGSQIIPIKSPADAYEITGKYDILERGKSQLSSTHTFEVESGHLGLLYSDEAHQKIIDWLKG